MSPHGTDLLFPPHIIPVLCDVRGPSWQALVKQVTTADETSVAQLAFVLLMVRLNNCARCKPDTYRALHGCERCAKQALRRYRGSDQELLEMYQTARTEVEQYLQKKV
ncbi:MAG: hypothetical protein GXP40_07220 [Chloroflexi bacterium]|nr:hypothetical protein [Chloroflexota bacterium]